MAKEKMNKVVGNSFENLKEDDMKKAQGAGDTEAEIFAVISRRLTISGPLQTASVTLSLNTIVD